MKRKHINLATGAYIASLIMEHIQINKEKIKRLKQKSYKNIRLHKFLEYNYVLLEKESMKYNFYSFRYIRILECFKVTFLLREILADSAQTQLLTV